MLISNSSLMKRQPVSIFGFRLNQEIPLEKKGYYAFQADKEHFEYWEKTIAPVVGIVYDPNIDTAFWIDITEHLKNNPSLMRDGSYTLHVPTSNEFSESNFLVFRDRFISYLDEFHSNENFGRSLDYFSMLESPRKSLEGFASLSINHRNRNSTWFYLISCFLSIKEDFILFRLIERLSLLSGHMDIFWHKENMLQDEVVNYAKSVIASIFGKREVVKLLNMVEDSGFSRGSFGYAIYTVIGLVDDRENILREIAFDDNFEEELRSSALFLFVHFEQFNSSKKCIEVISKYLTKYSDDDMLFLGMKETLEKEGFIGYVG